MALNNGIYHVKMPFMTTRITIDRAGRVVLPKPMRDNLQLAPGDWLSLESNEDEIVIRPLRGNIPLRKKRGVWTFKSGEPLSLVQVNQTVQQVRQEREQSNLSRSSSRHSRTGPKGKIS
jgi:AbrB family looped-hinge helix DNA binding protein